MQSSISHKYFSRSGRIRRVEYLIRVLILLAIAFVIGFGNALLIAVHQIPAIAIVIHVALIVGIMFANVMIVIKRQHDINLSAWYALLMLVPVVGTIWVLALLFIPGKENNQYGEPNSG